MSFSSPDRNIQELNLRGGERVVIFGSGAGGHTLAAARVLKGSGTVYGLDTRGNMVQKLKNEVRDKHFLNVRILEARFDVLHGSTVSAMSADVVIIPDTLFAYADKAVILKEATRIMRPGGQLLVIDWAQSSGGVGPSVHSIFSEDQALELAKQVGFEFVRTFRAGDYHYALIFQKPQGIR